MNQRWQIAAPFEIKFSNGRSARCEAGVFDLANLCAILDAAAGETSKVERTWQIVFDDVAAPVPSLLWSEA